MAPDAPLQRHEVIELRRRLRRSKAGRDINMSELGRLLIAYLLIDERPISLVSLSELTGYSRRSNRVVMLDFQNMGLASRGETGWVLTPSGRPLMLEVYRELMQIGLGKYSGFSGPLRAQLGDLPTDGVTRPFRIDG